MKKIKVAEASGAALDWLVAKVKWHAVEGQRYEIPVSVFMADYSKDWRYGGPIIEAERMHLTAQAPHRGSGWVADTPAAMMLGPTPLTAAMRCYVASKLGDEVEVPAELSQGET